MLASSDNPIMTMGNGKPYYFDDPSRSEFDIELVAKVLGRKQRFNDHADLSYSVAEHCYHASYMYAANRKGALMHDAAEFVMQDLITPIKKRVEGYAEIESLVETDLARRFNYERVDKATFKVIDNVLFQIERAALFGTPEVYNINYSLRFWKPETASKRFLNRFRELEEEQERNLRLPHSGIIRNC